MGFLRIMAGPVFGVTLLVTVYLLNLWLDFASGTDSFNDEYDDYGYEYSTPAGDPYGLEPDEYETDGGEMNGGYGYDGDIRMMLDEIDSDLELNDSGEIVAIYCYGPVADRHLQRIGELSQLETLYMASAFGVTDEGVRHLQDSTRLRMLNLRNSQLTNSGLRYLEDLYRLEELNVEGTQVTLDGVQRFQEMQPKCVVIH